MQPITNQSSVITTQSGNQSSVISDQPGKQLSNECNRISVDRFMLNRTVAYYSTIPSLGSATIFGITMTKYTTCGVASIIPGVLGIFIAGVAISCTTVQYCQNRSKPCNNPDGDHQKHCPNRNPTNLV